MSRGGRSFGMVIFGIVLILPLLGLSCDRIIKYVHFNQDCGGHIKRAADANTVETAIKEMRIVVKYLEDHQMTAGYTSVVYNTPDEDVGFWYNNLRASLDELEKVRPEATQLERSNILIKLRETLLDHGSDGDEVTLPEGISVFPLNTAYVVGFILFGVLALVGCYLIYRGASYY